jgi:lipoprotein signal peptidase
MQIEIGKNLADAIVAVGLIALGVIFILRITKSK